jgi:hypothetical protein
VWALFVIGHHPPPGHFPDLLKGLEQIGVEHLCPKRPVLKYLATVKDATNSEISASLKWSINRVTPRVHELREKNLVEQVSERACKITGRKVIAWRAVISKPVPANDPRNYRCHYCPKTAVTFKDITPVCGAHERVMVQATL